MDYKELFQAKLDELLELGTPLEEAEMQALEAMREALAGPYANGGRVHMQEGGEASKTYEELLADLDTAQADLSDGSVS